MGACKSLQTKAAAVKTAAAFVCPMPAGGQQQGGL